MEGGAGAKSFTVRSAVAVFLCLALAAVPVWSSGSGSPDRGAAMTTYQAIILGAVEGLTEFLPVSSTGHIILAQRFMGLGVAEGAKRADDAYAIAVQAGAIMAVVGLYFRRVRSMALGLVGLDRKGLALAANILAAFLPAAVIGLLAEKHIKQYLFGLWPIVWAWLLGGLAIFAMVRHQRKSAWGYRRIQVGLDMEDLTWPVAVVIGFFQVLAMWPGVSRSLATIMGGLLVGLNTPAAVEFSFLLGLITLGAATAYEVYKSGAVMLVSFGPLTFAIGFVMAFIFAAAAMKWMVAYLNRRSLAIFGWYRLVLAGVVSLLLVRGAL